MAGSSSRRRTTNGSSWAELARSELASDARFATADAPAANDGALADGLGRIFATRTGEEWESTLVPQGVACVVAFAGTMSEFVATDPVLMQTGLAAEVDHPSFGRVVRYGLPVRFSETPGRLAAGCILGQQTSAIMTELGYTPERIAELEEEAVLSSPVS